MRRAIVAAVALLASAGVADAMPALASTEHQAMESAAWSSTHGGAPSVVLQVGYGGGQKSGGYGGKQESDEEEYQPKKKTYDEEEYQPKKKTYEEDEEPPKKKTYEDDGGYGGKGSSAGGDDNGKASPFPQSKAAQAACLGKCRNKCSDDFVEGSDKFTTCKNRCSRACRIRPN